ncbi:flavin reductase family protein [Cellulomonas sp. JH27-2]|uniref:flavin reductase family protein n=1 Tax=Cellulomonas sp. JH27-2 TaxID=2774139 RepID=UPI001782283A|nr:flavin reductase family protein [Cellulomonas sp. JH27-2]MBD8057893.1 flavin reductase family protein [Cellulomonas sp. JH27-2]
MADGLDIDFDALPAYERYKLMASLIVPRPIALVTTVSPSGEVNAAPFSMFGMVGEDPPLLMISVNRLDDGTQKDTAANLDANGEFVVHIPDESIAAQMHRTGERFPPHVDELAEVGLTAVPSHRVRPPRIAEAPVAFECTVHERILTTSRQIYLGRIHHLHAAPGLVDTDRWRVTLADFHPVGRFGASFYVSTSDRFSLAEAPDGAPVAATDIDQL